MIRRIIRFWLLCLTISIIAPASYGEWQMRIHKNGDVEYHTLANIDSLTFFDNPNAILMAAVPAGTFMMGDGEATCGVDELLVTLTNDFYIGVHEVTNQEYLEALQWAYDQGLVTVTSTAVLDNMDGSTQLLLELDNAFDTCEIQFHSSGVFYLREAPAPITQQEYPMGYDPSVHPVAYVTWYGAARFCDWLSMQEGLPRAYQISSDWMCNGGHPYEAQGYRLPTDAEWEYAAQHDDERLYPWGSSDPDCSLANTHSCADWTTPVGFYGEAPEALGLSDMIGNVYEWCNDWHICDLGRAAVTDPVGPTSGTTRLLRGGAHNWSNNLYLRCASRNYNVPPSAVVYSIGFRVVKTIQP